MIFGTRPFDKDNMSKGKYYRHTPRPRKEVEVKGDKEVLSLPLSELGLNQFTFELLRANSFNTVYDVAAKTERDLFRIQKFNKRHLFEIKDKLRAKNLELLPLPQKSEKEGQADGNEKPAARPADAKVNDNKPAVRNDGRPDNRNKDKSFANRDKQKNQNGKKPNAPSRENQPLPRVELPLEEWRKVNKKGKWGFSNGLRVMIEPQFDDVFSFKDGLACVEIDEKFGYINSEGTFVIPAEYECALSFSEGLACVFIDEKAGYINKENQIVIPCRYDAATAFENGRAKVKSDGGWSTIAPDGSTLWSK